MKIGATISTFSTAKGLDPEKVNLLVTSISQYKIDCYKYWVIASLVVFFVSALLLYKIKRKYYELDIFSQDVCDKVKNWIVTIDFIFIIVFLVCLFKLIGWINHPEIRAIEYIIYNF